MKCEWSRTRSHSPEAQPARLLPDRVRHADPAEVVCERGAAHQRHLGGRKAGAPGCGLGELGHAHRVLSEPRRFEVDERGDGRERGVDLVARETDLRERLALERSDRAGPVAMEQPPCTPSGVWVSRFVAATLYALRRAHGRTDARC